MYAQLQPPVGGYRPSRLLDPEAAREATGVAVEAWTSRLLDQARDGRLSEEAIEYLDRVDRHPGNVDFETFALAADADIVGARYRLPLQVGWGRLVLSDLGPVREAFQAQVGRTALALGDTARAERVLRTTLAGAVQLARNAPFEVDVIEALRLALESLDGLETVLVAQGREGDVIWRAARERRGEWARAGYRAALFSADPAELFRALPALARDQGVPYAFRSFAYR
ncbi:MAG: hypothetical protein EXR95_07385 [Gemmatimonadetes bacterium]|nr:hypothetical protein [Gemmatimonadota bacterium]